MSIDAAEFFFIVRGFDCNGRSSEEVATKDGAAQQVFESILAYHRGVGTPVDPVKTIRDASQTAMDSVFY
jgi:hypothetical protein